MARDGRDDGRATAIAVAVSLVISVLALAAFRTVVFASALDRRSSSVRHDVETLLVAARWLLETPPDIDMTTSRTRLRDGVIIHDEAIVGEVDIIRDGDTFRIEVKLISLDDPAGVTILKASVFCDDTDRFIGTVRASVTMDPMRSEDPRMRIVGLSCYPVHEPNR